MLALACLAHGGRLAAQSPTSLQIDATVLPRHTIGVRGLTSFARFDEFLGDGGTRGLGSRFSSDSLGAAQIAQLGYSETQIRALSGDGGFAVKAGALVSTANARVMTAPLILEYGVTSRLTVGVVVPLVETRTTVQSQLNKAVALANVGRNPASASSWSTNASIVGSLRAAAANLQQQLSDCQANPSGAGCATLLAQQGAATALIAQTTPFASALENLYGTSEAKPGTFFVPVNGTRAQYAIAGRLDALRAQYAQFAQTVNAGAPAGAVAQSARADLQTLMGLAGYDSLAATDRSSIGDISIGATYQLVNTFDSTRMRLPGRLYRLSVNGAARIGTGEPGSRNKLFDNATGYGQPGAVFGAAADVRFTQRVYLTALGSYTMQFGTVDVARAANAGNSYLPLTLPQPATYSAGNEVGLTLIPRYRLGGLLSLDGIYALHHAAADTYTYPAGAAPADDALAQPLPAAPAGAAAATSHVVGFGFTYSSSLRESGPGRLPYEASFRHTETIAASGGPVAKVFADQLQLRIFLR